MRLQVVVWLLLISICSCKKGSTPLPTTAVPAAILSSPSIAVPSKIIKNATLAGHQKPSNPPLAPKPPQHVGIIVPYFGKLPKWFPLFAKTASYNAPYFTWFIYNDNFTINYSRSIPSNVKLINYTLHDFEIAVEKKMGLSLKLTPKKVCDFKVFYRHLFSEELKGFDFWGYTDIDMFFGNISHFITQEILRISDVVSSWSAGPIGPFSLYRITPKVDQLPFLLKNWQGHLRDIKHLVAFDEFLGFKDTIAKVIKRERIRRNLHLWYGYNPIHPASYVQDSMWFPCKRLHCNRPLPLGIRFKWDRGVLFRNVHPNWKNIRQREMMYFHFTTTKTFLSLAYHSDFTKNDKFCFNARYFISCGMVK